MTMLTSRRTRPAIALVALLASGCSEFQPNPTWPNEPGPGPGPELPTFTVPFRLGSVQFDEARGVTLASTGDILVASWFSASVDFDPGTEATVRNSFGAQDIAVARYSTAGEFQWVVTLGGANAEVPEAIAPTADGGAVVVGYGDGGGVCSGRTLVAKGGRDILIMKVDGNGSCEWAELIGGPDNDQASDVAIDAAGNIVVVGHFRSTADFDPTGGSALLVSRGGADAFVARYAADGSLLDATQAGGLGDDILNAVMIAGNGDLTVAGEFAGQTTFGSALAPVLLQSAGGTDGVIARFTPFMGLRWAVRIGGQLEDRATALAVESDGSVLVAGTFEGTADLADGPATALVVSQGGTDIFFARYDAQTGTYAGFSRAIGGPGSEGVTAIERHVSGNLIATGWFQETVDFDPGPGATLVVARSGGGAGDGFTMALAPSGDLAWVSPLGAAIGGADNVAIAYDLAVDPDGGVWTVGRFYGRTDFDPGTDAVELQPQGASDQFVTRNDVSDGSLLTEVAADPESLSSDL